MACFAQETSSCSYLPPCRNCILLQEPPRQSNLYTALDFLYWEGSEGGLEYAFKNKGTQFQQRGQMHKPHFEWEPAARFLLGYFLSQDKWWTLNFFFTYFGTRVKDQVEHLFDRTSSDPGTGIIAVWTAPFAFGETTLGARWEQSRADWKLRAYIFDGLLGHSLCVSSSLSIQPAFGLKLALLQQRYKVSYELGNTILYGTDGGAPFFDQSLISSHINMKNRSWNIGPAFALASRWHFRCHWSAFAAASAALFASHFAVKRNETDLALDSNSSDILSDFIHLADSHWTFRPQAALQLGLSWSHCHCYQNRTLFYALSLAYEAQYWWKQNMLLRYVDGTRQIFTELAPTQGDLFFQGLTLDARLDF